MSSTKFQVTLKKNGKKMTLPVETVWLEDDGKIFPCPSTFSLSRAVYQFIREFDARFDHAMGEK